jgi:hypothetical protein
MNVFIKKIGIKNIYCCEDDEYICFDIQRKFLNKNVKRILKKYHSKQQDIYGIDIIKEFLKQYNCRHIGESEYDDCDYRLIKVIC